MKNYIQGIALIPFLALQVQCADNVAYDKTPVTIPAILKEHKDQIACLHKDLCCEDLGQLLQDFNEDATTIGTLHRSVHIAAEALHNPELTKLDEELTEVYRKKCCCWPTTVASLTVTGTLRAGSVVFTNGVSIRSGAGAPTFAAVQGSLYLRTNGTASTTVYVNTDGTSGGWVAVTIP